jgi:hypothetical protein
MGGSETFGVESGFAEQAIEWMNSQAKKHKSKFEARAYNHKITTKNWYFRNVLMDRGYQSC